jgi:hypothetical protein
MLESRFTASTLRRGTDNQPGLVPDARRGTVPEDKLALGQCQQLEVTAQKPARDKRPIPSAVPHRWPFDAVGPRGSYRIVGTLMLRQQHRSSNVVPGCGRATATESPPESHVGCGPAETCLLPGCGLRRPPGAGRLPHGHGPGLPPRCGRAPAQTRPRAPARTRPRAPPGCAACGRAGRTAGEAHVVPVVLL